MRESVRGQRARARPVSQAQTGGVGGAANAQRRRGGGPRQISQRKLFYIISTLYMYSGRKLH